jgi:DNA recombination protein RmuC
MFYTIQRPAVSIESQLNLFCVDRVICYSMGMNTSIFLIILSVGIVVLGVGAFIVITRKLQQLTLRDQAPDQASLLIQQQLQELSRTVDAKLGQANQSVLAQLSHSSQLISQVAEGLTKVEERSRQVLDLKAPLESLQNILKNPKQRGVLGEYYLETVLRNILPPSNWQMQYKFADGEIVDAAIFVGDKIIPVDSKFSLENYNRIIDESDPVRREQYEKEFKNDLKKRIDETSKYIRPKERTMDFAFMFIPAEGIYYDLLVNQVGAVKLNTRDLIEYAYNQRHVVIVSPTSFHAYLQTVLQGLKAMQIEEHAKEIRVAVEQLGSHLRNYDTFMQKMGNHLGTTVGAYNQAYKEFGKLEKDVGKITGETMSIEPMILDKPSIDV